MDLVLHPTVLTRNEAGSGWTLAYGTIGATGKVVGATMEVSFEFAEAAFEAFNLDAPITVTTLR
jgi:hypothetical protein